MLRGMTAYVRRSKTVGANIQITWQIRSVNHRNLDVRFKIPDVFLHLEPHFREIISKYIYRSHIECFLNVDEIQESAYNIYINEGMLKNILAISKEIKDTFDTFPCCLEVSRLLSWPGLIKSKDPEYKLDEPILSFFEELLVALLEQRSQEGNKIQEIINSKLSEINCLVSEICKLYKDTNCVHFEKLKERLKQLKIEFNEEKIAQEIALLVTRSDIQEEIDRLKMHLSDISNFLSKYDFNSYQPLGKRLDFLVQECHRETNTMAAKSFDMKINQRTVSIKVLLAQIKEQIQNIE